MRATNRILLSGSTAIGLALVARRDEQSAPVALLPYQLEILKAFESGNSISLRYRRDPGKSQFIHALASAQRLVK